MSLASRRNSVSWLGAREGLQNPNFNGGRYIDDKGYIRILTPKHPSNNSGYVYEHRLVAEKHLGRFLQQWETIHHINELKLDNRWSNFYLTTGPEHTTLHREGKKQSKENRKSQSERGKQRARTGKRINGKFVKMSENSAIMGDDELENIP